MKEQKSIKDTLEVIRKALEDEKSSIKENLYENVLILNQKVNDNGKIDTIENLKLTKNETLDILDKKLDDVFEKFFIKWIDKNLPKYLEKYFDNKKIKIMI